MTIFINWTIAIMAILIGLSLTCIFVVMILDFVVEIIKTWKK